MRNIYNNIITKEEWELVHVACPLCGCTDIEQTYIGIVSFPGVSYKDTSNSVKCNASKCSWKGTPEDLVPPAGFIDLSLRN